MEKRRRVTEDDLLITEAMIAKSYGRLKRSIVEVPSQALESVRGTVKRHPLATVAAVAGVGLVAYGLMRVVIPRGVGKEDRKRPNLTTEILSLIVPLAAPYLMGYIKHYLDRALSGEHNAAKQ